jgi:hypothetical protein
VQARSAARSFDVCARPELGRGARVGRGRRTQSGAAAVGPRYHCRVCSNSSSRRSTMFSSRHNDFWAGLSSRALTGSAFQPAVRIGPTAADWPPAALLRRVPTAAWLRGSHPRHYYALVYWTSGHDATGVSNLVALAGAGFDAAGSRGRWQERRNRCAVAAYQVGPGAWSPC